MNRADPGRASARVCRTEVAATAFGLATIVVVALMCTAALTVLALFVDVFAQVFPV